MLTVSLKKKPIQKKINVNTNKSEKIIHPVVDILLSITGR